MGTKPGIDMRRLPPLQRWNTPRYMGYRSTSNRAGNVRGGSMGRQVSRPCSPVRVLAP